MKTFYYQRTGWGYEVKFIKADIVCKTDLLVGHDSTSLKKLKKWADDWTKQDWDNHWFEFRFHTLPPSYL